MQPTTDERRTVGTALAVLCDTKGYSQRQLAKESGVSQGTISNMIAGKEYEISSLFMVLSVLGKQIGDFFVDCGFTDEQDEYKTVTVKVVVNARRFKRVYGTVEKG